MSETKVGHGKKQKWKWVRVQRRKETGHYQYKNGNIRKVDEKGRGKEGKNIILFYLKVH